MQIAKAASFGTRLSKHVWIPNAGLFQGRATKAAIDATTKGRLLAALDRPKMVVAFTVHSRTEAQPKLRRAYAEQQGVKCQR